MTQPSYYRITWKQPNGRSRTAWARKLPSALSGVRCFKLLNKEGENFDPSELLVTSVGDIVRIRPARMNLKYAELEVA